jgi:hypothetical protein
MQNKAIFTIIIISLVIIFVIDIKNIHAQTANNYISTNYILSDPVFGEAGPYVSSPSFKERGTLGQLITGVSQSTNFILKSGFEYYSGQSVPSITMSLNTNSINFNTISPNVITNSPTNSIITISSNAESGYNLYISQNNNLTNPQGDTIAQVNNGATTTTAAPWTSASYYGLGYNCSTSNSYQSAVLANSPIGFWSLGEITGTTAYDLSGNGNNGTYNGGYTQGEKGPISNSNLGNSTLFNGSNSTYINLPQNITNNAIYSTLTFSLWFKTTSDGIMLGNQNTNTSGIPSTYNDLLYIGTNGYLCGAVYTPAGFCNNTSVNDGRWHNAVLTANNSTGQNLYLDGNLVNTAGTPLATGTPYNQIGTGFENDGNWNNTPNISNYWFPFKGEISNVVVYHTVLSSSQIQTLFNDGINSTQAFCSSDFINSNYYRQLSSTTNTEFASYSSVATDQATTVGYAINVPNTQASGTYTNNITYTVTGNY